MDRMVNYIRLAWKLAYMLRTYNSMVEFSKYEFNNKLLGAIILLRVTLSVTWIHLSLSLSLSLSLCVYIYIYETLNDGKAGLKVGEGTIFRDLCQWWKFFEIVLFSKKNYAAEFHILFIQLSNKDLLIVWSISTNPSPECVGVNQNLDGILCSNPIQYFHARKSIPSKN